jgi:hypothetical protein
MSYPWKIRWLLWRARVLDKLNRLDAIHPLSLGASLEDAVALYGSEYESGPADDHPDATCYTFSISPFHEALITIWNGTVHQVAYCSSHPDPDRDLVWMLDTYGEGRQWDVMTRGYSYRRKDGARWLWCSAAPVIGVSSAEFMKATAEVRGKA